MKSSIALIGFMGTGKTAVGQALAERLGKEFIETDTLIEVKAGRSIPEIFRRHGETAFRELEIEAIKEIAGRDNAVIACGGGVVLNKINIDRLAGNMAAGNSGARLSAPAGRPRPAGGGSPHHRTSSGQSPPGKP